MDSGFTESGPIRRRMRLLVTTRPVAWLSARYLPELDRRASRWSRGRITLSAWVTGLPIVSMTTVGARTGRPRTVRLLGIPDYHNVMADPRVTIAEREFVVSELSGDDRDAGFDRALLLNPGWTRFREQAGPRQIPVLRLAPVV